LLIGSLDRSRELFI